jgi:hypothetical protein
MNGVALFLGTDCCSSFRPKSRFSGAVPPVGDALQLTGVMISYFVWPPSSRKSPGEFYGIFADGDWQAPPLSPAAYGHADRSPVVLDNRAPGCSIWRSTRSEVMLEEPSVAAEAAVLHGFLDLPIDTRRHRRHQLDLRTPGIWPRTARSRSITRLRRNLR